MPRTLIIWLAMLSLVGCTVTQTKVAKAPLPIMPIITGFSSDKPEIIEPVTLPHYLTWGWPDCSPTNLPLPNIEFDVETRLSTDGQWSLYCRTNQPPVYFDYLNSSQYFRVGVHLVDPDNGPFYDDFCSGNTTNN